MIGTITGTYNGNNNAKVTVWFQITTPWD